MKLKKGIKILALALALLTVFQLAAVAAPNESPAPTAPSAASSNTVETDAASRLINVVYDDSGSMHMNGMTAWCQAKYSLEIFSAMMQDNDCMNVYLMDQFTGMTRQQAQSVKPEIADLQGDRSQQQDNIDRIHSAVDLSRGDTPVIAIEKAYTDLKANKASYDEKWLVVITDGDKFTNGETASDLNDLFSDCRSYGIKIVYLAIGSNTITPSQNTGKGLYVYRADVDAVNADNGILSSVTKICQRIFQRPAVETKATNSFTLDVPASEIIVFAQGKSVDVGDLAGAKKVESSAAITKKDIESQNEKVTGLELSGTVVTFTPKSGEYFDAGKHNLSISAERYEVYYKPCLDVVMNLKDFNGKVMTDEYIPEGTYTIEYWLSYPEGHPKHGERIPKTLFDVTYDRYCKVDGNEKTLTSDTIELKSGNTEISVVANYLNFISSVGTVKFVVEDFTIEKVDVSLEYNQKDYLLSTLEEDNKGIVVKVSRDGAPLPTEEWATYQIDVQTDAMDFKTVKNQDSSFTIYPQYKDGNRGKTKGGNQEFLVDVFAKNDHRRTHEGSAKGKISIYDDVTSVKLGVTVHEQDGDYTNKNFNDQKVTRKVTIDWAGKPLTKAQYDALKLWVEMDDDEVSATITKDPYVEGEPTTATITFKSKIKDLIKLHGDHDFTVGAEIVMDGEKSTGKTEAELEVEDARTAWEIFLDWLPWILLLLLILFLILAYAPIFKKYLPAKIVFATGRVPQPIRPYTRPGTLLTVLIPFVKVRTSIDMRRGPGLSMTMKVKAAGGTSAICTNIKKLNQSGFTISGSPKASRVSLRTGTIMYRSTTFAQFRRK